MAAEVPVSDVVQENAKRPLEDESELEAAKKQKVSKFADAPPEGVPVESLAPAGPATLLPTPEAVPLLTPAAVEEPPLEPGWERGTIKWFDEQKGFGFVTKTDGDSFMHMSSMSFVEGTTGLAPNTPVWLTMTIGKDGRPRTAKVVAPGGAPLQGTTQATYVPPTVAAFPPPVHHPVASTGGPGQPAPSDRPPLNPHTTDPLAPGRNRGTVKWYDTMKCFGFLETTDGPNTGEDIFVHQSALSGTKTLLEGEFVEFSVVEDEKKGGKKKATGVTGPGGQPVIGAPLPAFGMHAAHHAAHLAYSPYGAPPPHAHHLQHPHAHPPHYDPYGGYAPYGAPAGYGPPHADPQAHHHPAAHHQQQEVPAAAAEADPYAGMTPEESNAHYEKQMAEYYQQQAAYQQWQQQQQQQQQQPPY